MIATQFIEQLYPVRKVLQYAGISPSSYYFKKNTGVPKKRGVRPSELTLNKDGFSVPNSKVVGEIEKLLAKEFVDYGYLKVTYYLQDELGYLINHKKVFRLMQINQLLYQIKRRKIGTKKWVENLVPETTTAFSYWEFDIKFMYIHGTGRMVPLLTVIDVYSRWVLGHLFQESIKKEDVKHFFKQITETYIRPEKVYVRCDNGSQFESALIREYFIDAGIEQEFTRPATPQQNAHIESYHSLLERVICKGYEFETTDDCYATLNRWQLFYNYERIHSGTGYKSPNKFLRNKGIYVNQLFFLKGNGYHNTFIGLNQTETSSADEQLVRVSLAE